MGCQAIAIATVSLPDDCVGINPEIWAQIAGHVERREVVKATYQIFDERIYDPGCSM